MKILLTGASGFVGKGVLSECVARSHEVVVSSRLPTESSIAAKVFEVPDLNSKVDWRSALVGCDVVIHAAAHAATNPLSKQAEIDELYEKNTHAAVALAEQAAASGVKRFVFLSSVKVCGETSKPSQPMTVSAQVNPSGHYGESKLAAERGIEKICQNSSMEYVNVRPPLVYGPGVKANFAMLIKLVASGMPLPFGAACNKRAFVAQENLVNFVLTCVEHPNARNSTFLISDDDDRTMNDWLRAIAASLEVKPRLLPFPVSVLKGLLRMLGKGGLASSVLGSLELDIEPAKQQLEWRPAISVEQGLRDTAVAYKATQKGRNS